MYEKVSGLGIECSNICNMANSCTHCYGATGIYDNKSQIKLSDKIISIIAEEAPLIVESVTFTGGEPTSYPNLINRLVSLLNLPWVLMTNGSIFEKSFTPNVVLVSVDPQDLRPQLNPKIVVENSLQYEASISINTVLSREIDLFWFYELIKKAQKTLEQKGKKIQEWKIGFIVPEGRALNNPQIFPNWDWLFSQLRSFLQIYFQEMPFDLALRGVFFTKNVNENNSECVMDYDSNPCIDCFHREKYLVINAEEQLQLCATCRNRSITVTDSLIDSGIKLMQFPELNKYTYYDWQDCINCKWFKVCAAGCPALAEIYGQKWTGKDLLQCNIMEYTEKYLLDIFPPYLQKMFML